MSITINPDLKQIVQLEYKGYYDSTKARIRYHDDKLGEYVFDLNNWYYDSSTAIYCVGEPIKRKIENKFLTLAPVVIFGRSHWRNKRGYLIISKEITEKQRFKIGDIIQKNKSFYEITGFDRHPYQSRLLVNAKSLVNDKAETFIFKKMPKMKIYDRTKVLLKVKEQRQRYEEAVAHMKAEINKKSSERTMVPRKHLGYQHKYIGEIKT